VGASFAWFALFATVVLSAIWVAQKSQDRLPWRAYYTLTVKTRDLAGLAAHNEVRLAGERVGQVLEPRIVDGSPAVEVQLDGDVGPLPTDTRFVVRSKGLLGGRYLEVVRGREAATLRDGETVRASSASATIALPEVFNALDAPTRLAAGRIIDAEGIGVLGRGHQLNETFNQAPGLFAKFETVSTAILARQGAARRLAPSITAAASGAVPVRRDIATGFRPSAEAFQPFGDRRPDVISTLEQSPGTLATARDGLRRTDRLLVETSALSRALRRMLRNAPQALRQTARLLDAAPSDLRRADRLLVKVPAPVRALLAAAPRLKRELPRLDGALKSADPVLTVLAPHACDVSNWARNWSSMLSFGVPGGGEIGQLNALRLELLQVPSSIVQGLPLGQGVRIDPYPKPCSTGAGDH